jgi:hypothetical protein
MILFSVLHLSSGVCGKIWSIKFHGRVIGGLLQMKSKLQTGGLETEEGISVFSV